MGFSIEENLHENESTLTLLAKATKFNMYIHNIHLHVFSIKLISPVIAVYKQTVFPISLNCPAIPYKNFGGYPWKKIEKKKYTWKSFTNLLLTEREGRTREYWPEVVTVRTERSEVRTKTTEGQYSPVRPKQARLVSSLLYGTLFLIVKCTSGGLHLKNVRLLHPSLKFRKNFNLFSFCW